MRTGGPGGRDSAVSSRLKRSQQQPGLNSLGGTEGRQGILTRSQNRTQKEMGNVQQGRGEISCK